MPESLENADFLAEDLLAPNMANFQSQTINGIVILFYKNLLMQGPRQYTTAYTLCKSLAKRFQEDEYVAELEKIYRHTEIGFPLGILQTIVFRDLSMGLKTNKFYNYGFRAKTVMLGDMIMALDTSLDRIFDIFTAICVKHDIDTSITMPIIEGLEMQGRGLL
jgi:hypothetical protein